MKEPLYLVCRTCGEAFDELGAEFAYAHALLEEDHEGFDLKPESEAL